MSFRRSSDELEYKKKFYIDRLAVVRFICLVLWIVALIILIMQAVFLYFMVVGSIRVDEDAVDRLKTETDQHKIDIIRQILGLTVRNRKMAYVDITLTTLWFAGSMFSWLYLRR
jgi:Na+-transporting methylmalonyl-CoA/oxaloacetate decarboxylase beta subunit